MPLFCVQMTLTSSIERIFSTSSKLPLNVALRSLSSLENLNTIEGLLYISGNSELSICSISWLCDHIDDPDQSIDISSNAPGCNNIQEVDDDCPIVLEAKCKNATIAVQPGGSVDILASHIDDASVGATSFSVSPATLSCDNLGENMVSLMVMEDNGNSDNCTAIVTITDGIGLPGGWQASTIGSAPSGNTFNFSACNTSSNDEFSISGSGNNAISVMEDNIAFASQTLCGDGSITAKIESVDATGYGGLMIRETTDPGAKQTAIFSNLSNVLRHEVRYVTNSMKQVSSFFKPSPYWLRLERQGDWVHALYSATGSNFQYVHAVYLPMQNCVEIGLASFTFSPTGQATATFSNVATIGNIQNLTANNPSTFGAELKNDNIRGLYDQTESGVVFPNPAKNHFMLQLNTPLLKPAMIEVTNLYGQLMTQELLPAGQVRLEFSTTDWPAGGYLLKVHQPDSTIMINRIIVVK